MLTGARSGERDKRAISSPRSMPNFCKSSARATSYVGVIAHLPEFSKCHKGDSFVPTSWICNRRSQCLADLQLKCCSRPSRAPEPRRQQNALAPEAEFAILLMRDFPLGNLKVPTNDRDFFFSAHVDVAAPKALASDRFNGTGGPYMLPIFKLGCADR